MISVQGPHSRGLLQSLTDAPISQDEFLPFSSCRQVVLAGSELMMLRLTFVGELGYELHVPSECAVHVYQAIMQAADELRADGVPVSDAGYRAIDSMSAEKGYRHWHADLSSRDTPFEAGIGFVALAKLKTSSPFLGREALERQRAEGLRRRLVCLTLDEQNPDEPLHGRETIWRNDECVGFVRSTAYGFTVDRQIVYGYVDAPKGESLKPKVFTQWLKEGKWSIGDRGKQRAGTLSLKCPFDPTNSRIKGEYPPEVWQHQFSPEFEDQQRSSLDQPTIRLDDKPPEVLASQ
jgi:sarcosine dehydrogenase